MPHNPTSVKKCTSDVNAAPGRNGINFGQEAYCLRRDFRLGFCIPALARLAFGPRLCRYWQQFLLLLRSRTGTRRQNRRQDDVGFHIRKARKLIAKLRSRNPKQATVGDAKIIIFRIVCQPNWQGLSVPNSRRFIGARRLRSLIFRRSWPRRNVNRFASELVRESIQDMVRHVHSRFLTARATGEQYRTQNHGEKRQLHEKWTQARAS
jgi:hypothetical protein